MPRQAAGLRPIPSVDYHLVYEEAPTIRFHKQMLHDYVTIEEITYAVGTTTESSLVLAGDPPGDTLSFRSTPRIYRGSGREFVTQSSNRGPRSLLYGT